MHKKLTLILILITLILTSCQPAQTEPATPTEMPPPAADAPPTEPATPTETASPTESAPPTSEPTPAAETEPVVEPVEITYFAYHGGAAHGDWETANVAAFMELNPAIAINHRNSSIYGSPVPKAIDGRMNFDPPPDVVSGFMAGVFLDYVEQGLIADITDLWEENGWYDKFPQSVIDMATVDGRQYFVPTMLQFHPIWYRTDVFAKHNLTPPETWEDLLAVCDTLSAAGQTPFTVSIAGWSPPAARWFTYINLRVNGPEFHAALMRGQVNWEDARVFAVFEHWQQLFDHNCFAENATNVGYETAAAQLADGDTAMYLLGEWLSESYPDGLPAALDHFPFPIIDPAIPNGEIAHQYGAFLHANAPNPEVGRAFLTYLGSVDVHNSFGKTLYRISSHADLDQDLFVEMYWRGVEMTANAGYLTSLFELGTEPGVARAGLSSFVNFWGNPGNIATYLATLEKAREKAYGPLP